MLKFSSGSVTRKISNHLAISCSGDINDATFLSWINNNTY